MSGDAISWKTAYKERPEFGNLEDSKVLPPIFKVDVPSFGRKI